jgi:hypothetical protein
LLWWRRQASDNNCETQQKENNVVKRGRMKDEMKRKGTHLVSVGNDEHQLTDRERGSASFPFNSRPALSEQSVRAPHQLSNVRVLLSECELPEYSSARLGT